MTERETVISENFRYVTERIAEAVSRRGTGEVVNLLAATKTVPSEEIVFAADTLGLRFAGENRVQEFDAKYSEVSGHLEYHFIGHLQTNKVKKVVGRAALIHSVGSLRLAREIDRAAKSKGIVQDVLLEVNIAREESKSGFLPEEIPEALDISGNLSAIRVRGLMTMGPAGLEISELRKYLRETYAIFIDNFTKKPHNIEKAVLSMGMSESYEAAIEEGATMVRIGSALFGRRQPV